MIYLSAAANIHSILIILDKTYKVILPNQIGQQPIKIALFASTDSHWIYTLKRTCSKVHACLCSMNTFNKERNFSQRVGAHILDKDWILPRSSAAVRYPECYTYVLKKNFQHVEQPKRRFQWWYIFYKEKCLIHLLPVSHRYVWRFKANLDLLL